MDPVLYISPDTAYLLDTIAAAVHDRAEGGYASTHSEVVLLRCSQILADDQARAWTEQIAWHARRARVSLRLVDSISATLEYFGGSAMLRAKSDTDSVVVAPTDEQTLGEYLAARR